MPSAKMATTVFSGQAVIVAFGWVNPGHIIFAPDRTNLIAPKYEVIKVTFGIGAYLDEVLDFICFKDCKIAKKVTCLQFSFISKPFFCYQAKVQIFWEGHKMLKKISKCFWHCFKTSKQVEDFFKSLWSSQNI